MSSNEKTNQPKIIQEEASIALFQEWLELEEADEPSETKQDKILNYLGSALEDKPTEKKDFRDKVYKMGGKILCHLSFLPILGGAGGKGHFELTTWVFDRFFRGKLNITAINNFALASRYPDLYYPDQLHYHAMSQIDENHVLLDPTGQLDIEKLIGLLKNHLIQLDKAIKEDDINSIFFYIGMLFHSVQDLVVHKGMTSPQHAHLDKEDQSPDLGEDRLGHGKMISELFMRKFIYHRLTAKANLLEKCNTVGKLTSSSYKQIEQRKNEIRERKFIGRFLFVGNFLSHKQFLLEETLAFTKSARGYDKKKNDITWKFFIDPEHGWELTDQELIDSVDNTTFSRLK